MVAHPTINQSIATAKATLAKARRVLPRCTRSNRKADWYGVQIAESLELLERLEAVPMDEREQPYYKWVLKQEGA